MNQPMVSAFKDELSKIAAAGALIGILSKLAMPLPPSVTKGLATAAGGAGKAAPAIKLAPHMPGKALKLNPGNVAGNPTLMKNFKMFM